MTFFRARVVSIFYYNLNGEALHRTRGLLKNLVFFFDPKIKFHCHIINIVNKSKPWALFVEIVLILMKY